MNIITKHPVNNLGYGFIQEKYLPEGKDEYYLRNSQNKNGVSYRHLTSIEKEILIRNGNNSDDWSKILVSEAFDPGLVKNCQFFGLVRIGKLEPFYLEFHNLRMPVGLYNSTIISSDFGNNVCIDNASYLSHYIIGNEVMIANVNELATTNYSKFGNGILKDGEPENVRVWMEKFCRLTACCQAMLFYGANILMMMNCNRSLSSLPKSDLTNKEDIMELLATER